MKGFDTGETLGHCIKFMWQSGKQGSIGLASTRRAQQLPHLRSEPAPKRDPLVATAEPIRDAGWASGRGRFKKEGKKTTAPQQQL